jgi:NADH-quinone oxidoreductase subunit L
MFSKPWKITSGIIGTLSVLVSFIATAYFFYGIAAQPEGIRISLLTGFKLVNVDFGFQLDQLSILWLLFVTGIGL